MYNQTTTKNSLAFSPRHISNYDNNKILFAINVQRKDQNISREKILILNFGFTQIRELSKIENRIFTFSTFDGGYITGSNGVRIMLHIQTLSQHNKRIAN